MPMPEAVLKHFGCIDKSISFEPSHVMHFADDANLGYLTPTELSEVKEQAMEVQNMFEQYIDEQANEIARATEFVLCMDEQI